MDTYRAITIKRIYAERFANGLKRYEFRHFNTTYRGKVVITISGEKIAFAIADLTDVIPSDQVLDADPAERAYGKWAWKLDNIRLCEPIPCKGQLGLWTWHDTLPHILESKQLSFDSQSPITTWFEGDTLYLAIEGNFEYRAILSLKRQIRGQCMGIKDIEIEGSAFAIRFTRAAVIEDTRFLIKVLAQQFLDFHAIQPTAQRSF